MRLYSHRFARICNRLANKNTIKNQMELITTRFTQFIYFGLICSTHAQEQKKNKYKHRQTNLRFDFFFHFLPHFFKSRRFCLGHLFAEPTFIEQEEFLTDFFSVKFNC